MASRKDIAAALVGSNPVNHDQFYQSVGQFALAFAQVEITLQSAFWHLAGIPKDKARALFSGTRLDAAMNLMKRLGEVEGWPSERLAQFSAFSHQLGEINQLRNDLLHYGAHSVSPEEWLVSNRHIAHIEERIRETQITKAILDGATADLNKIGIHIVTFAFAELIPDDVRRQFELAIATSWHYKSSAQGSRTKPRPEKPQSQRSPRRSSRA